jgi:hypothetical protein
MEKSETKQPDTPSEKRNRPPVAALSGIATMTYLREEAERRGFVTPNGDLKLGFCAAEIIADYQLCRAFNVSPEEFEKRKSK